MNKSGYTRTAGMLLALGVVAEASAQTASPPNEEQAALAEVVVTATKSGATNLQKTPLAVTAVTADTLNQNLISNIKDMAPLAPSLRVSQVATNAVIAIRGIGSNNVYAGSDPDVTMQIDGVYVARPAAQFTDFLNVDRVEVLRGPQGTLYGRNAVGGTINIVSRQPTDTFSAQEVLTAGNYGLIQTQGYVSGALLPGKLQGSFSIDYIHHNDYEDNIAPNAQSGLANANHGDARLQLRYELTDNITATTRADWMYLDERLESYDHLLVPYPADALRATIVGNYRKVAINSRQYNIEHGGGVSEDIDVKLSDNWVLRSISAYRTISFDFRLDTDDTPLTINFGKQLESERQLSEELNLSARYDRFTGVAGLYYFYEWERGTNDVIVPAALAERVTSPEVWTRSAAVFAQGSYAIVPDLRLTVGGRYTHEKKTFEADYGGYRLAPDLSRSTNAPGFPILFSTAPSFSAFTPKFGLDWQVTPATLLYVSATRGYKSGGENYAATSLQTSTFAPEYIWSYEAGAKTEWLQRRLRLNLTGFYYDYKNLQVQSSIAAGVSVIGNAATATNKGLEMELAAQVMPALQLNAVFSYLDARYSNFASASVPSALKPFLAGLPRYNAALGTYDASGNYLNYAPRYSGLIGADYNHELGTEWSLFAHGDVSYQSRAYFDPSNSALQSQAGYAIWNASTGLRSRDSGWLIELWGRNLADKQYLVAMVASSLEPAGVAGAPRTFGVRLSKSW